MKLVLFIILLLSFVTITSLYISEEDGSLDKELKSIKHVDSSALKKLHEKYSKLNLNSKDLDLVQAIKEIQGARKLYPLDDRLKTIEIELEHKRTNKAYRSSKNTTPND